MPDDVLIQDIHGDISDDLTLFIGESNYYYRRHLTGINLEEGTSSIYWTKQSGTQLWEFPQSLQVFTSDGVALGSAVKLNGQFDSFFRFAPAEGIRRFETAPGMSIGMGAARRGNWSLEPWQGRGRILFGR